MRQNSWCGASVGGIVRQTPMPIMSPMFRVKYGYAMVSALVISQLRCGDPAVQSAPTL